MNSINNTEQFFAEIMAMGGTMEEVYILHTAGYSYDEIYALIEDRFNK